MLTIGSLFSGIGGLEMGLEWAGLGPVKWQVEINDYANQVLEKRWPAVRRYRDIFTLDGQELESVDLICGGFPCQPISTAGKQKGDKDERWLWPEFHRIVRQVAPRWVVVENVPRLITIDSGRLFGGVLRDLALCGYDAEWQRISAKATGAPHLRHRLFIVAHSGKERLTRASIPIFPGRSPEETPDSDGPGQRNVPNAQSTEREGSLPARPGRSRPPRGYWRDDPADGAVKPFVGRMAHGVPNRVDRLECIGNAVVPQVAEQVARRMILPYLEGEI